MKIFGIIGRHLGHSFSPGYFNKKFASLNLEAEYRKFELTHIQELESILSLFTELKGLNVTIPYKEQVIPFLKKSSDEVRQTGSCNTIKIIKAGNQPVLHGFNTDIAGFQKSLEPLVKGLSQINALVFGTGGSAKSVGYVLNLMGINYRFVSRVSKDKILSYNEINRNLLEQHLLLINTTPLGMFPDTGSKPGIPYQFVTGEHIFYDLVYNPTETAFIREGMKRKARTQNGLNMLKIQAEESWRIWQDDNL